MGLIQGIVALGLLLYISGIFYLGKMGLHVKTDSLASSVPVVAIFITTVAGALSTYVGMVLGFKQANKTGTDPAIALSSVTEINSAQTIASWTYVGSLVIAMVFWGLDGFNNELSSPVIQGLTKSLSGLIVGALAVYFTANNKS